MAKVPDKDLSFSEDSVSDIFLAKSKPKIIRNLPIQRPMQLNLRQKVDNEALNKILDDPALKQFVSPPPSKDPIAEKQKISVDTATQMTDRGNSCICAKLQVSNASNQTNDNSTITDHIPSLTQSTSYASFTNENVVGPPMKPFIYVSPPFRGQNAPSQAFKHRLNALTIKMNSYNINNML